MLREHAQPEQPPLPPPPPPPPPPQQQHLSLSYVTLLYQLNIGSQA